MKSQVALRLVHTKSSLVSPLSTTSRENTMSHKVSASHLPCSPRFQQISRNQVLKRRKSSSKLLLNKQVSGLQTLLKTQQRYVKEQRNLLEYYQSLYGAFFQSILSHENSPHVKDKASQLMEEFKRHKKQYNHRLKSCQEQELQKELKVIYERSRTILGRLTSKGKI